MEGRRKVKTGFVTSDKMDKTIVVSIVDFVMHPLYGKRIEELKITRLTTKITSAALAIRSELWKLSLSKDKRWRLVEIVRKG